MVFGEFKKDIWQFVALGRMVALPEDVLLIDWTDGINCTLRTTLPGSVEMLNTDPEKELLQSDPFGN